VGVVLGLVVTVVDDAVLRAESAEVVAQPLSIAFADEGAAAIGRAIPRREVRELGLDEWQVALPRGRLKSQRGRTEVRRLRLGDGAHERLEKPRRVRDAWQHRHHVDTDLDAVGAKTGDRAQACLRRRGPRLETTRQLTVGGYQRDV